MSIIHPPPETSPDIFELQFKRLFEAAECRTQAELAAILDIRQPSVSDGKKRSAIPAEWLVTLFEKRRINPEWVRKGTGCKTLNIHSYEGDEASSPDMAKSKAIADCTTDELLAELLRRILKNIG